MARPRVVKLSRFLTSLDFFTLISDFQNHSFDNPNFLTGNFDAEAVLKARAAHTIATCYRYAELNSPESGTLGWNPTEKPGFSPNLIVFENTHPSFHVCAPKNSWVEAWAKFREDSSADERLNLEQPKKKKKKDATSKLSTNFILFKVHSIFSSLLF